MYLQSHQDNDGDGDGDEHEDENDDEDDRREPVIMLPRHRMSLLRFRYVLHVPPPLSDSSLTDVFEYTQDADHVDDGDDDGT